jgi:protein gp37
MSEKSSIEWTDSSWNPCTGCTKISSGCINCYAERLSKRLQKMNPNGKYKNGFRLTLHYNDIELPLKWKTPRIIFVNSMSDLFHKNIPDDFIEKVFMTMKKAYWHTFQVLTKRPERMRYFTNNVFKEVLPNVWLGTTIENRDVLNRLEILKQVKARINFISFEPLVGPIGEINLSGIDWVIVGGESGPNYRAIKKEWILEIKRQCEASEVPFYFKQWGGFTPKRNGRILDGRIYDQYPKTQDFIFNYGESSCLRRSENLSNISDFIPNQNMQIK